MAGFDVLTPIEVDVAVNEVTNGFITLYESLSGQTLAPGDPRRIFMLTLATEFVQMRVIAQLEKRQALIRYAPIEVLETFGADRGVYRLPAEPAATTIQFTLSIPLASAQIIPAGTRVGPANGLGDLFFATTEALQIPAGATSGTVRAEATVPGNTGNGFLPGQLTTQVDPLPYVSAVTNLTESGGGSTIEDVEAFRERVRTAPEGFSTAGPEGAYIFFAKTASPAIVDVAVTSPAGSEVTVVPLLAGGVIPGQEVLDAVAAALNARDVRPMTDKVTVSAPQAVSYNIVFSYRIPISRQTEEASIRAAVDAAVQSYISWQQGALGRDIDPTELIRLVGNAGGIRVDVTSPVYQAVDFNKVAKVGTQTVTFGGVVNG